MASNMTRRAFAEQVGEISSEPTKHRLCESARRNAKLRSWRRSPNAVLSMPVARTFRSLNHPCRRSREVVDITRLPVIGAFAENTCRLRTPMTRKNSPERCNARTSTGRSRTLAEALASHGLLRQRGSATFLKFLRKVVDRAIWAGLYSVHRRRWRRGGFEPPRTGLNRMVLAGSVLCRFRPYHSSAADAATLSRVRQRFCRNPTPGSACRAL